MYNLELSLEDFYNGRNITVSIFQVPVQISIVPGILEGAEVHTEVRGRSIVFVLQQRRHERFIRKRNDLLISVNVPLIEALLGFEKTISLPDGKQVVLSSPPDKVIGHGDLFCAEGLGMPLPNDSAMRKGNLFVLCELEMPKTLKLSSSDRLTISRILGGKAEIRQKDSFDARIGDNAKKTIPMKDNARKQSKIILMKKADLSEFGSRLYDFGQGDSEDDGFKSQFSSFFFR